MRIDSQKPERIGQHRREYDVVIVMPYPNEFWLCELCELCVRICFTQSLAKFAKMTLPPFI